MHRSKVEAEAEAEANPKVKREVSPRRCAPVDNTEPKA